MAKYFCEIHGVTEYTLMVALKINEKTCKNIYFCYDCNTEWKLKHLQPLREIPNDK